MIEPLRYATFCAAILLGAASPGPANLFVTRSGLDGRRRRALLATLGITVGSLVWLVGASIGLAALLQIFPGVIQGIAALGGGYVAFLGAMTIRSGLIQSYGKSSISRPDQDDPVLHGVFRQGFFVQILNPNALLFFSAVLPPFINPARSIHIQIIALGLTTIAIDALVMLTYGMAASQLSKLLSSRSARIGLDLFVGSTLGILGILVAWRAIAPVLISHHL